MDIFLLLPGLSALALYIGGEYFPTLIGLALGILITYFLKKLSENKTLTYAIIIWLVLALSGTLLNSSYLAMVSVAYLFASLGFIASTEELNAGRASLIFFMSYLIPESVMEVMKLGLPPYKYLPYLIKLGAAGWSVPDLPVRIVYAISAGYLITAYLLRNVRAHSLTSLILILSGIYALVTAALTSVSGMPNAYYVAAIIGLLPLAILTVRLRFGRL